MKCKEEIILNDKVCCNKNCRYWIDYEEDKNCSLVSVDLHGSMTLHESAKRLNLSYVRVKQIQDKTIKKLIKIMERGKC